MQLRSGVVETLPVFAATPWQMSFGERATLEGVLSQLQPSLALEIGTAEGGSLRRVAAHAGEVHSFDLVPPPPDLAGLESVTFHSGDSHELLPRVLADLAAAGRNVDFVLVDGDHSAAGVKRDLLDLLASDAIRQTIVLLHDTMNDEVRAGIEAARAHEHPKVAYLDLDFVPGYLARHEPYRLELWGGLGLIAVDEARTFNAVGPVRQDGLHELFSIVRPTVGAMRELDRAGERFDDQPAQRVQARLHAAWARRPAAPQAQPPGYGAGYRHDAAARQSAAELDLERANRILRDMQASLSWRLTAPLRLLKRTLGRLTRA